MGWRPPGAVQKSERCAGQGVHRSARSTLLETAAFVFVDARGKEGVAGSTATATKKRTKTPVHARQEMVTHADPA